jgi:DNA-directed RNA polymerase subunit RPC12/RpoP
MKIRPICSTCGKELDITLSELDDETHEVLMTVGRCEHCDEDVYNHGYETGQLDERNSRIDE